MRWLLVGICALLAAALGLYPLILVEASPHLLIAAAAATVLFVVAAATGLWRCAGAGALLIVGEYALALIARDSGIDAGAVGVGVAVEPVLVTSAEREGEPRHPGIEAQGQLVGALARELDELVEALPAHLHDPAPAPVERHAHRGRALPTAVADSSVILHPPWSANWSLFGLPLS